MADDNINDNDNIIVSRMQQRRGLKQDLPQPLRPGEIGFAVDTRQIYIGGDPLAYNASEYYATSVLETTAGARQHVISIAQNNLIAFSVPFVKFGLGEFNGIGKTKQWVPTDARSTEDPTFNPRCYYSSKLFPVFDINDTAVIRALTTENEIETNQIALSAPTENSQYDIRVDDLLIPENTNTSDPSVVTAVTKNESDGSYVVTLDRNITVNASTNVDIVPSTIINTFSGVSFKSSDVHVYKNGIKLLPDIKDDNLVLPGPEYEYVLDASETRADGTHILTLASPPEPTDEVSICYYNEDDIINALENGVSFKGETVARPFYTQYNIPDYRKLNHNNIQVSKSSGMGFFGLEQKHLALAAEGSVIAAPNDLTLGNFQIQRTNQRYPSIPQILLEEATDANGVADTITIPFDPRYADLSSVSPITDIGEYRYNKIFVTAEDGVISNRYLCDKLMDVVSIGEDQDNITLKVPEYNFSFKEKVSAVPAGSNLKLVGSDSVFEGVEEGDWIRFFYVDIDLNQQEEVAQVDFVAADLNSIELLFATPFEADEVQFVNHGPDFETNPNIIQVYAKEHGFVKTDNITGNTVDVTDVDKIHLTEDSTGSYQGSNYPILLNRLSPNTFFINFSATGIPSGTAMLFTGKFKPVLSVESVPEQALLFLGTLNISPVLTVDLSNRKTLRQVVTALSKPFVEVKPGASENLREQPILPLVDYVPTPNNLNNAIYVTQNPAFSSVFAGGIEFTLHEDRNIPTLETLQLLDLDNYSSFVPRKFIRDMTVRAKLENWLNDLVASRNCNLFTNVFFGGSPYSSDILDTTTETGISESSNIAGLYNLVFDDTNEELLFCTREEATSINRIVNSAYRQSAYDRSNDFLEGRQGLLNLKNNLELLTRDTAAYIERITTYLETNTVFISEDFPAETELFGLGADTYNVFFIDYVISDDSSTDNKYSRVGQIKVVARSDFNAPNQVVITDEFNSNWQIPESTSPVVEPQFYAELTDLNSVSFKLVAQVKDYANPDPTDKVIHTLNTTLVMKYLVRRWNGTIF